MPRAKRGFKARRRRKKIMKAAKGFVGGRRRQYRAAVMTVRRGWRFATRDRKVRKRNFRSLWIQRINAGAREHGLTYGRLIDGLTKAGIEVDRKVMSDLAIHQPEAFAALVGKAKDALAYLKDTTPGAFEAAVQ